VIHNRSKSSHVELRSVVAEVRMEKGSDGKEKIRGYAAVFNSPSEVMSTEDGQRFVETIKPGAFSRALPECDVRALFNHDANFPLGRREAGTLQCFEDERGLAYVIDPPASREDVCESIRRGDIPGSSFSFAIIEDDWSEGEGGILNRELRAVHVFDVGPVVFPAYRATSATCRSLNHFKEERAKPPEVPVAYPTPDQIALLNHFRLAELG
jgi:HK97 family phage prohead protease